MFKLLRPKIVSLLPGAYKQDFSRGVQFADGGLEVEKRV